MASWKKIAEAFGRAMSNVLVPDDAKTLTQKMVHDVHRASTKQNLERKFATDEWGKNDPGIDEYRKGQDDLPWQDEFDRTKDYDPSSEHREVVTDAMTDRDLQDDFDKVFEEALDKRRSKIRDAMGDARGAEEAADAGINDIRKAAIEMLKSGQDIGDVLRILKGNN